MRFGAVNWKIRPCGHESDFLDHAFELLDLAASKSCEWVVFPELLTLELLGMAPESERSDILKWIQPGILEPIFDRARHHGITLVAGSTFVQTERGTENVSIVRNPLKQESRQSKIVLTQFEIDDWSLTPGSGLQATTDERVGVTICYDSEFPESGRKLANAGVLVQCVPAFTETEHGFWRVRHCCQARAVENQVYVIHASLVGSLGSEPVPEAVGSSAILAPSVDPFPATGVLAETPWNVEEIAVADLDFEKLDWARNHGDVRNFQDRNRGDW